MSNKRYTLKDLANDVGHPLSVEDSVVTTQCDKNIQAQRDYVSTPGQPQFKEEPS